MLATGRGCRRSAVKWAAGCGDRKGSGCQRSRLPGQVSRRRYASWHPWVRRRGGTTVPGCSPLPPPPHLAPSLLLRSRPLQLLGEHHAPLFQLLGRTSGRDVDKLAALEAAGVPVTRREPDGIPLLVGLASALPGLAPACLCGPSCTRLSVLRHAQHGAARLLLLFRGSGTLPCQPLPSARAAPLPLPLQADSCGWIELRFSSEPANYGDHEVVICEVTGWHTPPAGGATRASQQRSRADRLRPPAKHVVAWVGHECAECERRSGCPAYVPSFNCLCLHAPSCCRGAGGGGAAAAVHRAPSGAGPAAIMRGRKRSAGAALSQILLCVQSLISNFLSACSLLHLLLYDGSTAARPLVSPPDACSHLFLLRATWDICNLMCQLILQVQTLHPLLPAASWQSQSRGGDSCRRQREPACAGGTAALPSATSRRACASYNAHRNSLHACLSLQKACRRTCKAWVLA